jgi:hypothetical protein
MDFRILLYAEQSVPDVGKCDVDGWVHLSGKMASSVSDEVDQSVPDVGECDVDGWVQLPGKMASSVSDEVDQNDCEEKLNPVEVLVQNLLQKPGDYLLKHALSNFRPDVPWSPFISGYICNCGQEKCRQSYINFIRDIREKKQSGKLSRKIEREPVWTCGTSLEDDLVLLPVASAVVACLSFHLLTKNLSLEPRLKTFLITMFKMTLYGYFLACSVNGFPNIIGIPVPSFYFFCEKDSRRFVTMETKMDKLMKHPIGALIVLVEDDMHEHIQALLSCENTTPDLTTVVSFCFHVLSLPARILNSRFTQKDTLISILQKIKQIGNNYLFEDNGGEKLFKAFGYHKFKSPCGRKIRIDSDDSEY